MNCLKLLKRVSAWAIALSLMLVSAFVPEAAGTSEAPSSRDGEEALQPAISCNANAEDYLIKGKRIRSYLFENLSGGLTRVEYINGEIVVEDYTPDYILEANRTVPLELPLWGGFFAGEQHYYFIFGQNNPTKDVYAEFETLRVVKYSKDWVRLDQASIHINTFYPFSGGSLRCSECDGILFIWTCCEDAHQQSLTCALEEESMSLWPDFLTMQYGISHSFNQFILINRDGHIVSMNQGDAWSTRGFFLEEGALSGWPMYGSCLVFHFPGYSGQNDTGASIGGFAETADGYVSAFNFRDCADDTVLNDYTEPRHVYLGFTSRDDFTSTITKLTDQPGSATPILVSTGLDGGFIMWNGRKTYDGPVDSSLYFARYAVDGSVGEIRMGTAKLSDCQPILYHGKIVWYTTTNSTPVFYEFDDGTISAFPTSDEGPRILATGTLWNATWTLDFDGNMVVEGYGELGRSWKADQYPWASYKSMFVTLTIGEGITSIPSMAFSRCDNLQAIYVSENNQNYSSIDGVLYNKDVTELALLPSQWRGVYTMPSSVKRISSMALRFCYGTTAYEVAPGNQSFQSKDGVLFNRDFTSLVQYPISSDREAYRVPRSVRYITWEYAFVGCVNLRELYIGSEIVGFDGGAFMDAYRLKDVYYTGSESDWKSLKGADLNYNGLKRTMHYNYTDDAVELTGVELVDDAELGKAARINCKVGYTADGTIACARYDASGRMLGVDCTRLAMGEEMYLYTALGDASEIGVFAIYNSSLNPACQAVRSTVFD